MVSVYAANGEPLLDQRSREEIRLDSITSANKASNVWVRLVYLCIQLVGNVSIDDIMYVQDMDYIVSFFFHLDNRRSAYIFLFVPQLHNTPLNQKYIYTHT